MTEVDLLHGVGDSLDITGIRRHDGNKPVIKQLPYDVTNLFELGPIVYWLLNDAHVSDEAILLVTETLPKELADTPTVQSLLSPDKTLEDNVYDDFVESLCKNIRKDLLENNGETIRKLIVISEAYILGEMLGNEDVRDKFAGMDVYQLEQAVVKVTILSLARTHVELLDSLEEIDKLKESEAQINNRLS